MNYSDKKELLSYFRSEATKILVQVTHMTGDYKNQASVINAEMKNKKDVLLQSALYYARYENWEKVKILNVVLMITYVADVVMLEFRNKVWPYEYMAFARRIGELWEPFCKEVFHYPLRQLELISPPNFEDIQDNMRNSAKKYIDSLSVDTSVKRQLHYYYNIPWMMVDSGGIKLGLDLHFRQNGMNYNCDFKSGFSSNEKGNTNRLLLVASIYHFLNNNERTVLFVRQDEDMNNHYLQTLKHSGYWDVYCADKAYEKIHEFTGFNLRQWIDDNIRWVEDIDNDFKKHLVHEGLIKYLTW